MKKVLLIPNSKDEILNLQDKVNGFIVPLKELSINYNMYFTLEEIKDIVSKVNKEIFVSINKNMFNKDLPLLEHVLLELDNYHVKILYYDVSLVNMKKRLNLKNDLVWAGDHLVTNYSTINYWYKKGVNYAYLSSEITIKEMNDIIQNVKAKTIVNILGYIPMFTSRRKLVSNYLETFNKDKIKDIYYMQKEGIKYPIIENKDGTVIYTGFILNGVKEIYNINADYFAINSFMIENISEVLDVLNEINENNIEEKSELINSLIKNTFEGFLHKETIYKVK